MPSRFTSALSDARIASLLGCLLIAWPAAASTRSYSGEIESAVQGEAATAGGRDVQRGSLAKGTARLDQVHYTSNQGSWIGRTMSWGIHPQYSAAAVHGRVVSQQAAARVAEPGVWGYFYEGTWFDFYLTPEYTLGEVIRHDAAQKQLTLETPQTDKGYHYPESGEITHVITYADDT